MKRVIKNNEIYYEIVGEGTPVVILHGWGVDHRIMRGPMEPIFTVHKHYKRIYIDLPGMGKSKPSSDLKNSDQMVEILTEFIDQMIPNEQFLLMGLSYGGYLARAFVRNYPEKLLGVILLCPLMIPGFRKGTVCEHVIVEKDEELWAKLSEDERESFEFINVRLTRSVWEHYKEDVIPAVKEQNQEFLSYFDGGCSYDVDELTKPFEKPCLILVGSGDTEVGYEDQLMLLKKYKRASYVAVEYAGHNLQYEQPEAFTAAVSTWLEVHFDK